MYFSCTYCYTFKETGISCTCKDGSWYLVPKETVKKSTTPDFCVCGTTIKQEPLAPAGPESAVAIDGAPSRFLGLWGPQSTRSPPDASGTGQSSSIIACKYCPRSLGPGMREKKRQQLPTIPCGWGGQYSTKHHL